MADRAEGGSMANSAVLFNQYLRAARHRRVVLLDLEEAVVRVGRVGVAADAVHHLRHVVEDLRRGVERVGGVEALEGGAVLVLGVEVGALVDERLRFVEVGGALSLRCRAGEEQDAKNEGEHGGIITGPPVSRGGDNGAKSCG